jgi:hypothetical protein
MRNTDTIDDRHILASLGIAPEPFELVPRPFIQPHHTELLECFDVETEPLTPAAAAGILTLHAKQDLPPGKPLRSLVLGWVNFWPEQVHWSALHLEYGSRWRDGKRYLFSAIDKGWCRRFGIGTAAKHIDLEGDEQNVLRGTNAMEFSVGDWVRIAIYGRVLSDEEWHRLSAGVYKEKLAAVAVGDVIEVATKNGAEPFEVAKVSSKGTLYIRKPGLKSLRTITEHDLQTWVTSIRIMSTAGRSQDEAHIPINDESDSGDEGEAATAKA